MANIIITKRCNLNCSYCFARDYMNSPNNTDITIEQLENILNFLMQTPEDVTHIGLLGGEPLMHPQFDNIYNYIREYFQERNIDMQIAVITNGINLLEHKNVFNNSIIKINVNDPQDIGEENWEKIRQAIVELEDTNTIEIGINLYPGMENYNFIFRLAHEMGVTNIKCSYTAPVTDQQKNEDRFEYYEDGRELFVDFCNNAIENGITLGLDCNCIPLCIFTEEDLEVIAQAGARPVNWCHPAIDIMPDMTVSCCFGFPNTQNLLDFNSIEEIENYFLQNYSEPKANSRENCKHCELFSNIYDITKCQGGCFGFNN